ncbi:FtsX-like permease family protein [Luedemannella flava]
MNELIIGARMALTGGREGWIRTALTALGVGVGVAMLLLAASLPVALQARGDRGQARADLIGSVIEKPAANTLLSFTVDTAFRGTAVRGRLVEAEGPQAPVPPGLTRLPRRGEVAVSPALRDLLATPDGQRLFAPRLGGDTVTATIGDDGLLGPGELVFIRGADLDPGSSTRLDHYGDTGPDAPQSPLLTFLVIVIFVVLLLPLGVFLSAAVRFGGEGRDRRLAALRLLGADPRMTRLVAAGEAAVGALFGLLVGAGLFLLGRQLVPLVTLWDISVFAADIRPAPGLVAVIAVTVPAVAVVVSLVALRGVLIEPLGVTRRVGGPRRRMWWRVLLPAVGLALLWPLVGGVREGIDDRMIYQIAAGATLLLLGTVTLLPWLADLLVRRLRGGAVAWQLAVRRLQLDSAASARLVNGIAVAVAGTIGLHTLFAAVEREVTVQTGQDLTRAHAEVIVFAPNAGAPAVARALLAAPAVTGATATSYVTGVSMKDNGATVAGIRVGDCAALAEIATLGDCADGDVFVATSDEAGQVELSIPPGTRLAVGDGIAWTMPAGARQVPARTDPSAASRVGCS